MRRMRGLIYTLLAGFTFLTACQDLTTGPHSSTVAAAGRAHASLSTAAASQSVVPHWCFTSIATPNGPDAYRYGLHYLGFPRGVAAKDGSLLKYQYRQLTTDGSILWLANCVIPNTKAAIDLTHLRLKVPANAKVTYDRGSAGSGDFTTQGCVVDGACQIDGIVVVGTQPGDVEPGSGGTPPPPSDDGGSIGGGSGGGDGACTGCQPPGDQDVIGKRRPAPCHDQEPHEREIIIGVRWMTTEFEGYIFDLDGVKLVAQQPALYGQDYNTGVYGTMPAVPVDRTNKVRWYGAYISTKCYEEYFGLGIWTYGWDQIGAKGNLAFI